MVVRDRQGRADDPSGKATLSAAKWLLHDNV
jgi:hypothetical protein